MKKKLIFIVTAILLGGAMAYISYNKLNKIKTTNATAYQIGLFKNYDNALKKAKTSGGALIIKKGDDYQVIGSIRSSEKAKEQLEQYYKNQNISYYKKNITLDEEEKELLNNYELFLNQTTDPDILKKLNEKLLQELQERMNNSD